MALPLRPWRVSLHHATNCSAGVACVDNWCHQEHQYCPRSMQVRCAIISAFAAEWRSLNGKTKDEKCACGEGCGGGVVSRACAIALRAKKNDQKCFGQKKKEEGEDDEISKKYRRKKLKIRKTNKTKKKQNMVAVSRSN